MSRTTNRTKTANPGIKPPTAPKPPPKPPILSLQHFLTAQYAAEKANLEPASSVINGFTLPSKEAVVSIQLFDSTGDHHYADSTEPPPGSTVRRRVMDYSGSLVKVAAIYAAFDLRAEARAHAKLHTPTSEAAFRTSFEGAIPSSALTSLTTFGKGLKPDLATIFTGFTADGPNQIKFKSSGSTANKKFKEFLDDVFHNPSAGQVIRALGYSFINVSLVKGGFFDNTTLKGIWLAGDYSGEKTWTSVRVPVENDTPLGGSGQAITVDQMSRMFRLIHMREGYPHIADLLEHDLANAEGHAILNRQISFLFNGDGTPKAILTDVPRFHPHCAKIGIGSLGPLKADGTTDGPPVLSDGLVATWADPGMPPPTPPAVHPEVAAFNSAKSRALTGDFALVWQNMFQYESTGKVPWNALVRVVNNTIRAFLTQP